MFLESLLVLMSHLLKTTFTYPGGVPDLACESMFPSGHEAQASTDVPPYFMTVPTSTYRPGETVKLSFFSKRGHYFTGLYVQARQVGCHVNQTQVVGVFTAIDPLLETRHCFGKVHTAISHSSNVKKTGSSFYWTAPVVPSGHVVMKVAQLTNISLYLSVASLHYIRTKATVVKDKTLFWTDVDSAPLIDLQSSDTPYCVSHTHRKDFHFVHSGQGHEAKTSHLDGDSANALTTHITLNIIMVSCWVYSIVT